MRRAQKQEEKKNIYFYKKGKKNPVNILSLSRLSQNAKESINKYTDTHREKKKSAQVTRV